MPFQGMGSLLFCSIHAASVHSTVCIAIDSGGNTYSE